MKKLKVYILHNPTSNIDSEIYEKLIGHLSTLRLLEYVIPNARRSANQAFQECDVVIVIISTDILHYHDFVEMNSLCSEDSSNKILLAVYGRSTHRFKDIFQNFHIINEIPIIDEAQIADVGKERKKKIILDERQLVSIVKKIDDKLFPPSTFQLISRYF